MRWYENPPKNPYNSRLYCVSKIVTKYVTSSLFVKILFTRLRCFVYYCSICN